MHVRAAVVVLFVVAGCSPSPSGEDAGAGGGTSGSGGGTSGTGGGTSGTGGGSATGGGAATGGGSATGGGTATGGGSGGSGGGSVPDAGPYWDGGYVPMSIPAAITKELSPLEVNEPAIIELGTLSYYPVELSNPRITVPAGLHLDSIVEVSRSCPTPGTGGLRCRQYFEARVYSDPACQLDGMYQWQFDVTCAPGGDCRTINPALTQFSVTTTHDSADFCAAFPVNNFALFRPSTTILLPVMGTNPYQMRWFTTLDRPYRFTSGTLVPPDGGTLVSFVEDTAAGSPDCDGGMCRQWWRATINPGPSCTPRGTYSTTWNVQCDMGGNCDPTITTWTVTGGFNNNTNLCP